MSAEPVAQPPLAPATASGNGRSTAARVAALVAQSGGAVQPASTMTIGANARPVPVLEPDTGVIDATTGEILVAGGDDPYTTAQRLRRVMATTPQHRRPSPAGRALDDASVAALLGGEVYDTGVIVVDRQSPRSAPLTGARNLSALARRGTVIDDSVYDNLVYLDTETTGLSGGTGTVVFILGLARCVNGQIEVRQFVLTGFVGERALLAGAYEWLDEASALVTYNGLSFDVPLLLTRFRLAQLPNRHRDTLSQLPHLDLLHPMRAAFSRSWPNCTLQMAEKKLLNHHRVDDLPGSMVPAVFTDLVRYGRTSKLRPAVDHNRDDLVSLASLVDILGGIYAGNGVGEAGGVARRLVRQGDADRALQILLQCTADDIDERDALLLARLERRAERLQRQAEREAALAQRRLDRAAATRSRTSTPKSKPRGSRAKVAS